MIATKRCTQCHEELPATPQYFYERRVGERVSLRNQCRECRKLYSRAYYHRPEIKQHILDMRQESERNTARKVYNKNYSQRPETKEKNRIRSRLYYWTEQGQAKAKIRRRSEKVKLYRRRSDVKARDRKRRQSEKGKAYERNYRKTSRYIAIHQSQEFRQRIKIYRNSPRGKAVRMASFGRRRAREVNLPCSFSTSIWEHCLEYFNHRCAVCLRPVGLWHTLAADHWIPIASPNCPGTIPTNIVPLCHGEGGCNNQKNKQMPDVWLIDKYGIRKARRILKKIGDYFDSVKDSTAV